MTLADLIHGLQMGVQRDDIASEYKNYVNIALRAIQRRRSFVCMRQIENVIIQGSQTSAPLPDNFKELTIGRSPVHRVTDSSILVPCDVWTREKTMRRGARFLRNQILNPNGNARIGIPVYLDWSDGVPTLNIGEGYVGPQTFSISFYGFMEPLEEQADSNYLTENYPEMCLHKAKTVAFEAINDPASETSEQLFNLKFREAAADDAYRSLAGLDLRM